jgi:hypothetical protein
MAPDNDSHFLSGPDRFRLDDDAKYHRGRIQALRQQPSELDTKTILDETPVLGPRVSQFVEPNTASVVSHEEYRRPTARADSRATKVFVPILPSGSAVTGSGGASCRTAQVALAAPTASAIWRMIISITHAVFSVSPPGRGQVRLVAGTTSRPGQSEFIMHDGNP